MTYQQLLATLNGGNLAPVYLLEGEEGFFIDRLANWFEEHALPAEQAAFNRFILYGAETTALSIAKIAVNLPMFGDRQLVLVREAQMLKGWDDLLSYLERPAAHTVLVFCHKSGVLDRRTRVGKLLEKQAVVFQARKISDQQLAAFTEQLAAECGLRIAEEGIALLAEHVGKDLSRLQAELQKLRIALGNRSEASADDIARHVGISREYNAFELSKALASGDRERVARMVAYFSANPKATSLFAINGLLYSFFSRVYVLQQAQRPGDRQLAEALGIRPFLLAEYNQAAKTFSPKRLQTILSLLLEYDVRAKGIDAAPADEGGLMKELLFRILDHP
ncbi:MAG: DNA polymerase III subunit delta [Chitinophagales bacterium]|nr:DNA polymerase III subunit delta [Chitinophagales bacterium]